MSMMNIKEFDDHMTKAFPDIKWREAITVIIRGKGGFGCRLCIGRLGLEAKEPEGKVFPTLLDFQKHMETTHEILR